MKPVWHIIPLLLCCTVFLCGQFVVRAQSFEEYKKKSQSQFNSYRQKSEDSLNQFRNKINREFSNMLGRPWEIKRAQAALDNPLNAEPPAPIPMSVEKTGPPKESRYRIVYSKTEPQKDIESSVPPLKTDVIPNTRELCFIFMNSPCAVHIGKRVVLAGTGASAIADAWESMSTPGYYALAADYISISDAMALCDWASLCLAEEISFQVTGSRTSAEAVLLQVWLLSQAGLQARMAKDEQGDLRRLITTDKQLFDCPAFFCENNCFYITDGRPIQKAEVQPCLFPGTRPLRMAFTVPADTPGKTIAGKQGYVDETLIRFYEAYPEFCDDGQPITAFRFRAMVPLSAGAQGTLYSELKRIISEGGLSNESAARLLLAYIQNHFPYKEDRKVWQRERYFYPEETLFYEFSDCEDRAILYTRLVRDLLGLKTALVYYPGHLAAAVCFEEYVPGDAVIVEGERFLICDPTYIGAGIGQEMPTVDRLKAVAIPL